MYKLIYLLSIKCNFTISTESILNNILKYFVPIIFGSYVSLLPLLKNNYYAHVFTYKQLFALFSDRHTMFIYIVVDRKLLCKFNVACCYWKSCKYVINSKSAFPLSHTFQFNSIQFFVIHELP